MGNCKCGYTRDAEKNCDGSHKIVKAVKEQIAQEIEEWQDFMVEVLSRRRGTEHGKGFYLGQKDAYINIIKRLRRS